MEKVRLSALSRIAKTLFVQHLCLVLGAGAASAATYYVSPEGNDAAAGSQAAPWRTFDRAWNTVARGDTLILLDGIYYQSLTPRLPAPDGRFVTIKAANEGKAIIDGQHARDPVVFQDYLESSYVILEGLTARNGSSAAYYVRNDHVILRRCSGYDVDVDDNTAVFLVWANDVLIEDCVSAGTGRKQFLVFSSRRVTIRRSFAMPLRWDGRLFCAIGYPYTSAFEIYTSSDSTLENNIGYARADAWMFYLKTDGPALTNNELLGNVALFASREPGGAIHVQPSSRPSGGDNCTDLTIWAEQPVLRSGFAIYPGGPLDNHLFQDNLAHGNAGLGLAFQYGTGALTNFVLRRFEAFGNGVDNAPGAGGPAIHADMLAGEYSRFTTREGSRIERLYNGSAVSAVTGEGARLRHRYVDGVLMDGTNGQPAQALWPWPMEQRIQGELGVSVTALLGAIVPGQVTAAPATPPGSPANVRVVR